MEPGRILVRIVSDTRFHVLVWCCLLGIGVVAATPAAAQQPIRVIDVAVGDSDFDGPRDEVLYLWQDEQRTIDVHVATGSASGRGHYEVCLTSTLLENGSGQELACRETVLSGDSTEVVTFSIEAWPDELVGRQSLTATVYAGTLSRERVANASVSVAVHRRAADLDGDGLTNEEEVTVGTNLTAADTDGDGLVDSLEWRTYGTDPTAVDSDGDGLMDGLEVTVIGTSPTDVDTDDDGLGDALEYRELGTAATRADTDGDGLDDAEEVNAYGTDPRQPDTDGDGLDDRAEVEDHETDPLVGDTDGDGLGDTLEVYTYGTDPRKADTDDDGLDDGVEVFEARTDPTRADTDGDGLKDGPERNAYGTNPNLADTDGDGLDDGSEIRIHDTDPTLADTDGDGIDDGAAVEDGFPEEAVWSGLVAIATLAVAGAVWVRRRGYPAPLRSSRLVPVEAMASTAGEGRPENGSGVSEVPTSNPERVQALLRSNGGRMQQSSIVEATDWSKAKVSRVLMRMEEDDQITKINVGRENIITLPGEEPERAQRPFEDEDLQGIVR